MPRRPFSGWYHRGNDAHGEVWMTRKQGVQEEVHENIVKPGDMYVAPMREMTRMLYRKE